MSPGTKYLDLQFCKIKNEQITIDTSNFSIAITFPRAPYQARELLIETLSVLIMVSNYVHFLFFSFTFAVESLDFQDLLLSLEENSKNFIHI